MRQAFLHLGCAIFLLVKTSAQFAESPCNRSNQFEIQHNVEQRPSLAAFSATFSERLQTRLSAAKIVDDQSRVASMSPPTQGSLHLQATDVVERDYGFVNSFLAGKQFDLGDHGPFPASLGQEVNINGLVCRNLSIGSVGIKSETSPHKTDVHVDLSVSGVSLFCHAVFLLSTAWGHVTEGTGQFLAESHALSKIGASFTLKTSHGTDFDRSPPRSATVDCNEGTKFDFNAVSFQGHSGLDFLGQALFRQRLGAKLAESFKSKLCEDSLPSLIDALSQRLLAEPEEPPQPKYSSLDQDDAAAVSLARRQNAAVLDIMDDRLAQMMLKVMSWVDLNEILRSTIISNVPSSIVLLGTDTLANLSMGSAQGILTLNDVMLDGVNSVRNVSLFKRSSKHSAAHSISFDLIALQVAMVWEVRLPNENKTFPVNATVAIQGLTLDVQTMIAFDKLKWLETTFGSAWDMAQRGKPAACILKALLQAELTDFEITFDNVITSEVHAPVGSDGLPSGLAYITQEALALTLKLYGGFVEKQLAPFVSQTTLREALNSRLKAFVQDPENQLCPAFDYEAAGGVSLLNFSDGFAGVAKMINTNFQPDSNSQQLVANLTKKISGTPGEIVLAAGEMMQGNLTQANYSPHFNFSFGISNVSIVGLDGTHDVVLLQPQGEYNLHNAGGLGNTSEQSRRPGIKADASVRFTFDHEDKLKLDAQIKLDARDIMAIADWIAMLDTNKLLNLTFSRVSLPCIIGSLDDYAVRLLSLVFDDIALDIQCKNYEGSCSQEVLDIAHRSHNQVVRAQATEQLNHFVQGMLHLFQTSAASQNYYKLIHSSHNSCWGVPSDPGLALSNPSTDKLELRALNSSMVFMAGWFLPMLWICILLGFGYMWLYQKPQAPEMERQVSGDSTNGKLDTSIWSTSRSSILPFLIALFLNILLFVVAHFHIGAEVNLVMTFMGAEAKYEGYSTMNAFTTVYKLWSHEAYLLAVLIALFSIVWPYVKLLSLLAIVFASTEKLPYRRRERYLFLLDRLGKYSMLDVYFIILVFGILQLEFGAPSNNLLFGPDFLRVKIEVMPCFGMVTLILGILLSIILNQVALSMHRRSVEKLEDQKPGQLLENERMALCDHVWQTHMGDGFKQATRQCATALIAMAMVLSAVLMSIGWFTYMSDTKIHGVAGLIKSISEGHATTTPHSFFRMAAATLDAASRVTWDYGLGIILVAACHVVFAGVLPLLQLACMMVLWLKPLTLRNQKRMNLLIQALSAVASMDVFLFAIAVGNVQITHLSEGFLSDAESNPNIIAVLQTLTHWGIIDKAHLLSLDVAYHWSWVLLAWGATLNCILSSRIIEWSKHAERDRLLASQSTQGLQNGPEEVAMSLSEPQPESGASGTTTWIEWLLKTGASSTTELMEPLLKTDKEPQIDYC